jgi:hypothetical protein
LCATTVAADDPVLDHSAESVMFSCGRCTSRLGHWGLRRVAGVTDVTMLGVVRGAMAETIAPHGKQVRAPRRRR